GLHPEPVVGVHPELREGVGTHHEGIGKSDTGDGEESNEREGILIPYLHYRTWLDVSVIVYYRCVEYSHGVLNIRLLKYHYIRQTDRSHQIQYSRLVYHTRKHHQEVHQAP